MQMAAERRQLRRAVQMSFGDAIDKAIESNAEMPVQWKIEHGLLPLKDGDWLRHGVYDCWAKRTMP